MLVDTSIWVDHLRRPNRTLVKLLEESVVCVHPWVIGELACGNLKNRAEIISLLKSLPFSELATDEEVLELIESRRLMGKGIGWIDAHLLASCLISGAPLWTGDKALRTMAAALRVLF